MRTLENMGSELNLNRSDLFSSPQLRQRAFVRHHELQGLSPRIGMGQQVPKHFVQVNDIRPPQRQVSFSALYIFRSELSWLIIPAVESFITAIRIFLFQPVRAAVLPHQSPRLVPNLTCSPLRGRSSQMSPRTPRLGRPITHQLDQAGLISQMPQITRHEMGFDRLGHPNNVALPNGSKLLCSPKVGMELNPTASPVTPRVGRLLYAKPKGVPRTTTIDFQAFSSPARKLSGETS